MALTIPERDKARFAKFLRLDFDALESLQNALAASTPHLQLDALVAEVRSEVKSIDEKTLRDVLRLLLTFYRIRNEHRLDAPELAEELCAAAAESGDENLREPTIGWVSFKERLAGLLALDTSILITAKAAFISSQFPRHLHNSRILTDARPVFGVDITSGPAAFVITHTLQFELNEDGQDHDWFILVDTMDLHELRDAIDRALEKDLVLRVALEPTNVPVLDWEE